MEDLVLINLPSNNAIDLILIFVLFCIVCSSLD